LVRRRFGSSLGFGTGFAPAMVGTGAVAGARMAS
jgi:hypothetical protein